MLRKDNVRKKKISHPTGARGFERQEWAHGPKIDNKLRKRRASSLSLGERKRYPKAKMEKRIKRLARGQVWSLT